jgi:hypothetical protein
VFPVSPLGADDFFCIDSRGFGEFIGNDMILQMEIEHDSQNLLMCINE